MASRSIQPVTLPCLQSGVFACACWLLTLTLQPLLHRPIVVLTSDGWSSFAAAVGVRTDRGCHLTGLPVDCAILRKFVKLASAGSRPLRLRSRRHVRIGLFGGSVSAGHGVEAGTSYPQRLQHIMPALGMNISLENFAAPASGPEIWRCPLDLDQPFDILISEFALTAYNAALCEWWYQRALRMASHLVILELWSKPFPPTRRTPTAAAGTPLMERSERVSVVNFSRPAGRWWPHTPPFVPDLLFGQDEAHGNDQYHELISLAVAWSLIAAVEVPQIGGAALGDVPRIRCFGTFGQYHQNHEMEDDDGHIHTELIPEEQKSPRGSWVKSLSPTLVSPQLEHPKSWGFTYGDPFHRGRRAGRHKRSMHTRFPGAWWSFVLPQCAESVAFGYIAHTNTSEVGEFAIECQEKPTETPRVLLRRVTEQGCPETKPCGSLRLRVYTEFVRIPNRARVTIRVRRLETGAYVEITNVLMSNCSKAELPRRIEAAAGVPL
mmetsp:Transcript_44259/g.137842  ORF Transcript_44259/g.137842 Transcript_44259/m.137842 type:complete len:492 (+) Transcript_44259:43-1518(+)